ncbi:hypothetical protein, partial [Streptococcus pneumoniae]|uniref:hypothetical protein n=1 Tax=Streptococcus pneumoniae TaxID=1313 RepID=UPI001CBD5937
MATDYDANIGMLDDDILAELQACVPDEVERLKAEGIAQYNAEQETKRIKREAYRASHPQPERGPAYAGQQIKIT